MLFLQKGFISAGRISPNKNVPSTDSLNTILAGKNITVFFKYFGWKKEINSHLTFRPHAFTIRIFYKY